MCTNHGDAPRFGRLTEEEAARVGGGLGERVPRTCEQEAGDRRGVQLLGAGDVVAIQEVVQQVDGQVPGSGAELAVAAQQGQDVHKEPAAFQERRVGSEGGQLQFLEQAGQKGRGRSGLPPESLGCPRKARGGSPPAAWLGGTDSLHTLLLFFES